MISKYFFYLFIVFIPFQISTLIFGQNLYFGGFFSTYHSHYIYLNDIFLLIGLIFFGIELLLGYRSKFDFGSSFKIFGLFGFFFALIFLNLFFTLDFWNSLFYLLRFLEFFLVYLLLVFEVVSLRVVFNIFVSVMTFVALLGIIQFLFQHSLGLSFFGEPVLAINQLGVAKIELFGVKYLRAYATFPHPNIFAGYLVFSFLMILNSYNTAKLKFRYFLIFALVFTGIALILTFSRSALIALAVFLIFHLRFRWKYLFLLILLPLVFYFLFNLSELAVSERIEYIWISLKMFLDNLWGVGLGNFTNIANNYSISKLEPWILQPVHNIFLLILAELGFLGFFGFIAIFFYFLNKFKWQYNFGIVLVFIVLIIGQFDHYFITIYQGQFLLFLAFANATLNDPCSH